MIAHIARKKKFWKLTPTILNDMVNAVYVHSPDKSSRHRVQDVEISYNYIGILPATLLYDLQNGKTAWPKSRRFPKTIMKLFYWTAPSGGLFVPKNWRWNRFQTGEKSKLYK